jgi:hypothetical protein
MELIKINDRSKNFVGYFIKELLNPMGCNTVESYYKDVGLTKEDPKNNLKYHHDKASTYYSATDDMNKALLNSTGELLSDLLERKVLPSYAYTRAYSQGTELISHRDRRACEISVTVSIMNNPDPYRQEYMYLSKKPKEESEAHEIIKVPMVCGDALVFFGSEESEDGYYHWRDVVNSESLLQVFLHYVYADGEHTDEAFMWLQK